MGGLVIKGSLKILFFLLKLTHGANVMTGKGFNFVEMLGPVEARLEVPASRKDKSQLPALNVRIHTEQEMGSFQQKYLISKQAIYTHNIFRCFRLILIQLLQFHVVW